MLFRRSVCKGGSIARFFGTSPALNGKKNFRKFPLHELRGSKLDIQTRFNKDKLEYMELRGIKFPGFVDKRDKFVEVPEMIPDIVVPDLTDFKLKPYVSYKVPDVVQSAFTARDLFYACYADKMSDDFKNGKLDEEGNSLEPSDAEKMTAEEAWIKARQTGSDLFCPEDPLPIEDDYICYADINLYDPEKDKFRR